MNNTINTDKTILPDSSDSRADLEPGTRLGRYEIIKLLGRGGMGQVYLVRHEMQDTLHALKILPRRFSDDPSFDKRFQAELQTMARLQHPHIVHVTHSDEENGVFYLVMDFIGVDGEEEPYDLEEALAEEKKLSPELTRHLMLQVCDGLRFAHESGVVHRDLKPANILLDSKTLDKAGVRVADFGLARVLGEEQVRTMVAQSVQASMSMGDQSTFVEKKWTERSSTGAVLGTYGYMSPEQEEGKTADERSDIYALGVMMYRMLTGKRLRGMAKPASQVVEGLDPAWDDIIGRCLESDPADRWQSVEELYAAIEGTNPKKSEGASENIEAAIGCAFLLLLLFLGCWGVHWGYKTYTSHKQRAVIQNQQLAAEKLAHVDAVVADARSALAADQLKIAETKIAELNRLAGKDSPVVRQLQAEYEKKTTGFLSRVYCSTASIFKGVKGFGFIIGLIVAVFLGLFTFAYLGGVILALLGVVLLIKFGFVGGVIGGVLILFGVIWTIAMFSDPNK